MLKRFIGKGGVGKTGSSRGFKYNFRTANGRKRKTTIMSLENEEGEITDQEDNKNHIYSFYETLFEVE